MPARQYRFTYSSTLTVDDDALISAALQRVPDGPTPSSAAEFEHVLAQVLAGLLQGGAMTLGSVMTEAQSAAQVDPSLGPWLQPGEWGFESAPPSDEDLRRLTGEGDEATPAAEDEP